MKTVKTVLAVALVVAGISYTTYAHPPGGQQNQDCCTPQPEDFRSCFLDGSGAIIPSVEGVNGMIITDMVCQTSSIDPVDCFLRITPLETLVVLTLDPGNAEFTRSVHFQSGLPVPAGAEILSGGSNVQVTISGYVY